MSALLDADRRGVAVQGATLHTTTFPCHNCARHIVGAGIDRVVFIVGVQGVSVPRDRIPLCDFDY
jgi:deoxycytidylate deaminase